MNRKKMKEIFTKFFHELDDSAETEEKEIEDTEYDPGPSTSGCSSTKTNKIKRLKKHPRKETKLEDERRDERRKLFDKKRNGKHEFEKNFRCLDKKCSLIPVPKPTNVASLEKSGLWGRMVKFMDKDDMQTVKTKIEAVFPELVGGFKMMKSHKNGKSLYLIGKGPMVDGKELKAVSAMNIYLCPLQKNIDVVEESDSESEWEESECTEMCINCGKVMPLLVLEAHSDVCDPQSVQMSGDEDAVFHCDEEPAVIDPVGMAKIHLHQSRLMEFSDDSAYADRDLCGNAIDIKRTNYVEDAIRLSKEPFFLSRIKRPLVVTFIGEAGVDGGGLRRAFLSMIVDYGSSVLSHKEGDVGLELEDIDEIYYMLGIFLGLAVIQVGLCPAYVIAAWKEFGGSTNRYHPFVRGLAAFQLNELFGDKQVQSVFMHLPVTVALIVESLENNPDSLLYCSQETKMCQAISYNFFIDFLNNVADGKVSSPNHGKVTLEDVYLFYTGSKIVPICWDTFRYKLNFKMNDDYHQFRPTANTCAGCAQLTIPVVASYKDMEAGWIDAILSISTGFSMV